MKNSIVNHYKIHAFKDRDQFLDQIKDEHKILVAMNAEKILKDDERLRQVVNRNIGYPDGIGAVMALRQKGLDAVKIPGAEFWLDIIGRFQNEKSFYLIGSTQEVIEHTVAKLRLEFPDVKIAGYRNGYLKPEDIETLKNDLLQKKPDVVFVAQGSPRQEFLMDELVAVHLALYMGLGGSFDLYTGVVKSVPDWWKKIFKWEGLYRSINEIGNIDRWKRQLKVLKFIYFINTHK
jgi:UDP-N-acetyl-D-mannosaminouronate:lipid I N-acetyl-D-mannosaminouronosyltransferase